MCYRSSYDYDKRLHADSTRSFLQLLRDLFRRAPRPQPEAEVIPLQAEARTETRKPAKEHAEAA